MLIHVCGNNIETREITGITLAGRRQHGFSIHLLSGKEIFIGEAREYDASPSECIYINSTYEKLREQVESYWNRDRTDVPILIL
jgi:hypothetical protein